MYGNSVDGNENWQRMAWRHWLEEAHPRAPSRLFSLPHPLPNKKAIVYSWLLCKQINFPSIFHHFPCPLLIKLKLLNTKRAQITFISRARFNISMRSLIRMDNHSYCHGTDCIRIKFYIFYNSLLLLEIFVTF